MLILKNIAFLLVIVFTLIIFSNVFLKRNNSETPVYRCDCGLKKDFDVSNNAFLYPWLVTIYSNHSTEIVESWGECQGSILASRYIVTAAHCVTDDDGEALAPDQVLLVPGVHNKDWNSVVRKLVPVSHVSVHEKYNNLASIDRANDIAVLELSRRLDLNTYTPVCLSRGDVSLNGKSAEVLVRREDEASPLESFEVTPVSYQEVLRSHKQLDVQSHSQFPPIPSVICSKIMQTELLKHGDSGGPLLYQENGQYSLVGVISRGSKVATLQKQSDDTMEWVGDMGQVQMYSSMSFYKDWVQSQLKNPEYCITGSSEGNITFPLFSEEENVDLKPDTNSFSWSWSSVLPFLAFLHGLYLFFSVDFIAVSKNILFAIANPRKFFRGEIAIFPDDNGEEAFVEQNYPPMLLTITENLILVMIILVRIIRQLSQQMPRYFL